MGIIDAISQCDNWSAEPQFVGPRYCAGAYVVALGFSSREEAQALVNSLRKGRDEGSLVKREGLAT